MTYVFLPRPAQGFLPGERRPCLARAQSRTIVKCAAARADAGFPVQFGPEQSIMQHTQIKRIQVLAALRESRARLGDMRVADLMTKAPACVSAATSALELVKLFHAKNFRHLLVTDRTGRLEGVISDRDVLRCFGADRHPSKKALAAVFASQLMSTDVVTIGPTASLVEALRLMLAEGISCLPVMADEMLVGIITNTDLHVMLDIMLERYESTPEQDRAACLAVGSTADRGGS